MNIRLGIDHPLPHCVKFSHSMLGTMQRMGNPASVLPVPLFSDSWRQEHRTARKRADRATRLGYEFMPYEREQCVEDRFEINTSLEHRQGRRMGEGYWERPSESPLPPYPCPLHAYADYGVFSDSGQLVAYLVLIRCGQLRLISQILGHGDFLEHDIMYLLALGTIKAEIATGGYFVYNRHDSGTEGLRYYKEKLGFEPQQVTWTV
jgi:hypothetical protein